MCAEQFQLPVDRFAIIPQTFVGNYKWSYVSMVRYPQSVVQAILGSFGVYVLEPDFDELPADKHVSIVRVRCLTLPLFPASTHLPVLDS